MQQFINGPVWYRDRSVLGYLTVGARVTEADVEEALLYTDAGGTNADVTEADVEQALLYTDADGTDADVTEADVEKALL